MSSGAPVQVTRRTLAGWPLPRIGSDKESRGRVLVAGGTPGTPGAVLLAGEAALRAGAGKLQIATAPATCTALGVAVPEAATIAWPHAALAGGGEASASSPDHVVGSLAGADTVLVGPGVSDPDLACDLVAEVLAALSEKAHLVVDALGSAFLTGRPDGLGTVEARAVVTVNPLELAHVIGAEETEIEEDLAGATAEASRRTGAVVLGGGEVKHVAAPDGSAWVVTVGGPGLGVSGSGDVQSGIVSGLLARGCEPAQAAVWGAYLHGAAGEMLSREVGAVGFLARQLPGTVPALLADLAGRPA